MTNYQLEAITRKLFWLYPLSWVICPITTLLFFSSTGFLIPLLSAHLINGAWRLTTGCFYQPFSKYNRSREELEAVTHGRSGRIIGLVEVIVSSYLAVLLDYQAALQNLNRWIYLFNHRL